ncbi:hypothetical protein [Leucobacter soli]|uniref:hypothetical protein n=1 Tax=Leucobacter soli TaxID=2812850 RepID=UPI0036083E2C
MLGDIGGSMAATEALSWDSAVWTGATTSDDFAAFWPEPDIQIQLPFWPLAAGLGFAALAAIFRYGSRLQRDQEGLV